MHRGLLRRVRALRSLRREDVRAFRRAAAAPAVVVVVVAGGRERRRRRRRRSTSDGFHRGRRRGRGDALATFQDHEVVRVRRRLNRRRRGRRRRRVSPWRASARVVFVRGIAPAAFRVVVVLRRRAAAPTGVAAGVAHPAPTPAGAILPDAGVVLRRGRAPPSAAGLRVLRHTPTAAAAAAALRTAPPAYRVVLRVAGTPPPVRSAGGDRVVDGWRDVEPGGRSLANRRARRRRRHLRRGNRLRLRLRRGRLRGLLCGRGRAFLRRRCELLLLDVERDVRDGLVVVVGNVRLRFRLRRVLSSQLRLRLRLRVRALLLRLLRQALAKALARGFSRGRRRSCHGRGRGREHVVVLLAAQRVAVNARALSVHRVRTRSLRRRRQLRERRSIVPRCAVLWVIAAYHRALGVFARLGLVRDDAPRRRVDERGREIQPLRRPGVRAAAAHSVESAVTTARVDRSRDVVVVVFARRALVQLRGGLTHRRARSVVFHRARVQDGGFVPVRPLRVPVRSKRLVVVVDPAAADVVVERCGHEPAVAPLVIVPLHGRGVKRRRRRVRVRFRVRPIPRRLRVRFRFLFARDRAAFYRLPANVQRRREPLRGGHRAHQRDAHPPVWDREHGRRAPLKRRRVLHVYPPHRAGGAVVRLQERVLHRRQRRVPRADRERARVASARAPARAFALLPGAPSRFHLALRFQRLRVVAQLEAPSRVGQRSQEVLVLPLFFAELLRLSPLEREDDDLTVPRPACPPHALDRPDRVHDVEEHDEVHGGDVQPFLADARRDDRVQRPVPERVEDGLLFFLRLPFRASRRARAFRAAAAAALAAVALADELRDFYATLRAVGHLGRYPRGIAAAAAAAGRGAEHPGHGFLPFLRVHEGIPGAQVIPAAGRDRHLSQRSHDVPHRVAIAREHDRARRRIIRREVPSNDLRQARELRRVVRAVSSHRPQHVQNLAHHRGRAEQRADVPLGVLVLDVIHRLLRAVPAQERVQARDEVRLEAQREGVVFLRRRDRGVPVLEVALRELDRERLRNVLRRPLHEPRHLHALGRQRPHGRQRLQHRSQDVS
eukprot:22562-Pelagococcus_subviridis.AAC.8